MDYQIVTLQSKNVVGITSRTRNSDESMEQLIGGLWSDFYNKGIYQSIENKSNNCSIGLYSDYETDENGEYSVTIGCEVNDTKNVPKGTIIKYIPQGKYAKFIVEGDTKTAIQEFWTKLWEMPLDRAFSSDFEEHQPESSMGHGITHIYVALK